MNLCIDEFEQINGCLQKNYNAWRGEAEMLRRENGAWFFPDAGSAEARRRFSKYCNLTQIIPFEVMLWYENTYERK